MRVLERLAMALSSRVTVTSARLAWRLVPLVVLLLPWKALAVEPPSPAAGSATSTGATAAPVASSPAQPAASEYVGSARCQPCHAREFETWKDAPHARTLHVPGDADRARLAESLQCADRPVRLALGLKRHIRFVAPDPSGVDRVLPCRWNRATEGWDMVGAEPGPVFADTCAWCHQTGPRPRPVENGVGCEACHGPGAAHAADPEKQRSFAFPPNRPELAASVCGACHLQGGLTREGLSFPEGFRPGTDLREVFRYDWQALDAAAGDHHAQKEIRSVLAGTATQRVCVSCHDPHRQTALAHGKLPVSGLCAECHVNGSAALRSDREAVCPVCEL